MQKGADISVEEVTGDTPYSVLCSEQYKKSDVSCINSMIREIAKRNFFNILWIPEKT